MSHCSLDISQAKLRFRVPWQVEEAQELALLPTLGLDLDLGLGQHLDLGYYSAAGPSS